MAALGQIRPTLFPPGPNELGAYPFGQNELGDPLPPPVEDEPTPVAAPVLSPLAQRKSEVEADLEHRMQPKAPAHGILGHIGRTAANIGNVLGDIFAPAATALIPGSDLNNERIMARDKSDLDDISRLETEEQSRKQSEATTAYTEQRPDIERAKNLAAINKVLVPKGYKPATYDENGDLQTEEDQDSEAFKSKVALNELHQAQAERQLVMAQMGQPGSPLYEQKQRQLDQIDKRIGVAMAGLGLRKEALGIQAGSLALREDQNYNPEPTAQERTKGDLASSAVHQIQVMRDIVNRRKDLFGPAAGSGTKFQTWLGSEDPDAAAYNAAQTYLAEHSAGVFGGRGAYILQNLHSLSNQRQNDQALNSFLDEAEGTANKFVSAGTTHAKGTQGHAAAQSSANSPLGTTTKPDGVYEMNGKQYRVEKGQVYAH